MLSVQTFLLAVISHLLTAQPLSRTCYSPSSPVLLAVLSPFAFFSDFSASCPMSHLLTAQQLSSTSAPSPDSPAAFLPLHISIQPFLIDVLPHLLTAHLLFGLCCSLSVDSPAAILPLLLALLLLYISVQPHFPASPACYPPSFASYLASYAFYRPSFASYISASSPANC
jgi:hypothetical protein